MSNHHPNKNVSPLAISGLPYPPPGKSGWPWTEGSVQMPPLMPDGKPWPRITLVTPSYNQGWALEETLRSVLVQGYPNLEYIVMDGASADESVAVIKKYEPWLDYWESAKDQGQADALKRGFAKASGQIYGWLNSDDYFLSGALKAIAELVSKNPEASAWVGTTHEVGRNGAFIRAVTPSSGTKDEFFNWSRGKLHFHQPACFFSAKAYKQVGGLDDRMWCTMDMDLWIRLRDLGDFAVEDIPVACARIYPEMKSAGGAGNPKSLVDLITIAVKHDRRAQAETYVDYCKNSWKLEMAREITPELALRYIDPEDFMDRLSMKKIFKYFMRRCSGLRNKKKK